MPGVVPSPTSYWLRLKAGQPVVRAPGLGFCTDDRLLVEADPARFPKEVALFQTLCVVRSEAGGLRLATLTHHAASDDTGPEWIEADYHDAPAVAAPAVVEHVYRHLPNGDVEHVQRRYADPRGVTGIEPDPPSVRYTDGVGVWLKILFRR